MRYNSRKTTLSSTTAPFWTHLACQLFVTSLLEIPPSWPYFVMQDLDSAKLCFSVACGLLLNVCLGSSLEDPAELKEEGEASSPSCFVCGCAFSCGAGRLLWGVVAACPCGTAPAMTSTPGSAWVVCSYSGHTACQGRTFRPQNLHHHLESLSLFLSLPCSHLQLVWIRTSCWSYSQKQLWVRTSVLFIPLSNPSGIRCPG